MSKLAEIFSVEAEDVVQEVTQVSTVIDDNPEDDDFIHSRAVQRELIEQGRAAVNTAMRIAAESEQPRSIEVLSGILKTVSDMNSQLLGLSKAKNDIKAAKGGKQLNQLQGVPQIGTQNIIAVGSGSDINKMLLDKMKNG